MPTYTDKFDLIKPLPFDLTDADVWGGYLNTNFDTIDNLLERSMEWLVVSKGANYPVTAADYKTLIAANASTASFNVTLPLASANAGLTVGVKKVDATVNTVTVNTTGSDTIDGQANIVLSTQYEDLYVVSDGTTWNAISKIVVASQAEAEAGVNNTKAMTPLRVFQGVSASNLTNLGFNKYFQSAEQTVVASGNISVTHTLGVVPKHYYAVLRCITSEFGYTAGVEIPVTFMYISGGIGLTTWANGGALGVSFVNTPAIMGLSDGIIHQITPSSWRWVLRAWG